MAWTIFHINNKLVTRVRLFRLRVSLPVECVHSKSLELVVARRRRTLDVGKACGN
jgi:hypothetical protein